MGTVFFVLHFLKPSLSDLFMIFNVSGDGSMSMQEFVYCWNGWITKIVKPKSALVVVDVQNDFISGSLAIKNCPAGKIYLGGKRQY